jgi:hypothetical protein
MIFPQPEPLEFKVLLKQGCKAESAVSAKAVLLTDGIVSFFPFLNLNFVLYKIFQFWVVPGIFFAWHHIFAMLPAAAAHLFGPFNSINWRIFLFAGYSSFGKYNSSAHFYSPPLIDSSGKYNSQDLVSVDEHTASRRKFFNSIKEWSLNKNNMMQDGEKLPNDMIKS